VDNNVAICYDTGCAVEELTERELNSCRFILADTCYPAFYDKETRGPVATGRDVLARQEHFLAARENSLAAWQDSLAAREDAVCVREISLAMREESLANGWTGACARIAELERAVCRINLGGASVIPLAGYAYGGSSFYEDPSAGGMYDSPARAGLAGGMPGSLGRAGPAGGMPGPLGRAGPAVDRPVSVPVALLRSRPDLPVFSGADGVSAPGLGTLAAGGMTGKVGTEESHEFDPEAATRAAALRSSHGGSSVIYDPSHDSVPQLIDGSRPMGSFLNC